MRRLLISSLGVVSVSLVFAAAAAVGEPAGDSIVGGGRDAFEANISVSAFGGLDGQGASGHVNASLPFPGSPGEGFRVRIQVTCVAVDGTLGAIGGVTTDTAGTPFPAGTPFVVVFRDTGIPGGVDDAIEPFAFQAPETCAAFLPLAAAAAPMRSGDITIHDA